MPMAVPLLALAVPMAALLLVPLGLMAVLLPALVGLMVVPLLVLVAPMAVLLLAALHMVAPRRNRAEDLFREAVPAPLAGLHFSGLPLMRCCHFLKRKGSATMIRTKRTTPAGRILSMSARRASKAPASPNPAFLAMTMKWAAVAVVPAVESLLPSR